MNQHFFNIGTEDALKSKDKNEFQTWWQYCLNNNVITAGFNNELGDEGTQILRDKIKEGSWVFAYVNEHGYVGIGLAESTKTYKLWNQSELPSDYISHHCHHRSVKWLYYIDSVKDAVSINDVGGYLVPAKTEGCIQVKGKAEEILRAFWNNKNTKIRF